MIAWRHGVVLTVFLLAALGLCVRVVYLGVTERDFLQGQGDARSVRTEIIPAMRGVISDRHGEPLAISTPVYAVWTDPSQADFDGTQLKQLARQLGLDEGDLQSRLDRFADREFVYLKRRLNFAAAERLRAAKLPHVHLQPEYRRYYPGAETTAHVVGLTDLDDRGIEGIEYAFNDALTGRVGRKVVLKDLRGNIIRDLEYLGAPVYGTDLRLSLDLRVQFTAYRELKSAFTSHKAQGGSVVVLDVPSGEVLALVNQPSYNPNDIGEALSGMRNRAVTDSYEPGSTIKPFTALAALESGHYDADTAIDTSPGFFRIGRKLVQDPTDRGVISLETALQHSSQVAFAKIALELPADAVYGVLSRAGLGSYLGTGLPGEVQGYMDSAQLRYPVVRAVLAYGYGLSVTPLQLASAYLSLATYGIKRPLTVLRDGNAANRGERIFDADLAREVVEMMEKVTDPSGTAPGAAVAAYRVAGKTGTARMVGAQGYDDERHAAWFAGVAPVSNPRIVVVVLVNEPAAGLIGGGAVAAPIFSRIVARVLPLLGERPDKTLLARADAATGGARGL